MPTMQAPESIFGGLYIIPIRYSLTISVQIKLAHIVSVSGAGVNNDELGSKVQPLSLSPSLGLIGSISKNRIEDIIECWLLSGVFELVQALIDICGSEMKALWKPNICKS